MSKILTHPTCGKSWAQHGNRTGHCSSCHETFEGLSLFDAHQRILPDGSVICLQPADMRHHGQPLRLIDGTWRGPALPQGTFGGVA